MSKIVISGGACAGKSTLINELKSRGFSVISESAFELLHARNFNAPRTHEEIRVFQEEVAIRQIQRKYFAGKMSAGGYHRVMGQQQERLAKIRKTRLTLRNKRVKLLSSERVFQELGVERLAVESEIKKLQEAFYRDRKIPESEYKSQFQILNERLAEIEGERTTLELLREKKTPVFKESKSTTLQGIVRLFRRPIEFIKRFKESRMMMEENKIREKIRSMGVL